MGDPWTYAGDRTHSRRMDETLWFKALADPGHRRLLDMDAWADADPTLGQFCDGFTSRWEAGSILRARADRVQEG